MHLSVAEFVHRTSEIINYANSRVVEVGAQNVNGRAMDAAGGKFKEWVGIDLVDGPDIQHVGDATQILPALAASGETFDIAVSTEVLEHAPVWAEIVLGLVSVLPQGGHLVLTCAGPGRTPHNADGGPELLPNEYYKNISLEDLDSVLSGLMITLVSESSDGDTRYFGVKR